MNVTYTAHALVQGTAIVPLMNVNVFDFSEVNESICSRHAIQSAPSRDVHATTWGSNGSRSEDLVCKTIDALADPSAWIPYSALSYAWGEYGHRKAIIHINGYEFHATENLYLALQQIRKKDRSVYLSADAICINQDNEEEKGHQVRQMGATYAGAEEVLIWLGEMMRT